MTVEPNPTGTPNCRICHGVLEPCVDLGRQPVSQAFLRPHDVRNEVFYRLSVGVCRSCGMAQQLYEVPREQMFRADYPYRASGSVLMRRHFEAMARHLLETELTGPDPFVVEIGSNDGVMLGTVAEAGVRHLGVDPSAEAAQVAAAKNVKVRVRFFEEASAADIRVTEGLADVIYSANTISHIAYLESVFRGVDLLLKPAGVFVFEDRYLGDIVANNYLDQIYDEHFYLFSIGSVRAMAERFGFELVDAQHLPVHGGAVRYTVARPGVRRPTQALLELLEHERDRCLSEPDTLLRFAADIQRTRTELLALLRALRAEGHRVVGYGATAKSATVTNFCGIGPELVPYVCDSTPGKQGLLTPGTHIPVRPAAAFADPLPDYALLFAWNHAEEIMAKEHEFRERGGRWILYVPDVHLV